MAFPDDRDRALQHDSFNVLGFADDLLHWVGEFNPDRIRNGIGAISNDEEFQLLSLRRTVASLYRSSRVPAATAVYGPSQAGKSLFVGRVTQPQDPDRSPLGRDENAGPPAYYPGLSVENDLNPNCGAQEATAIVTRFTTKDRYDERAGRMKNYPVMVRGLSRAEWLRVLSRGFRSECAAPSATEWRWDEQELEDLFIRVAGKAPANTFDRTWRMDLLDLYAYLKKLEDYRYPADETFLNGLLARYPLTEAGYVEIAANLGWANWPELTALFREVNSFLERITRKPDDGESEAQARLTDRGMLVHWAAVRFLLDSQQKSTHESPDSKCFEKVSWNDIIDREEDGWYCLDYSPGQGPPRVPLTTIQSAMLEMVVPVLPDRLTAEWRAVIADIDFLDIPGMKLGGATEQSGDKQSADSPEVQQSVVKRGKVFYLFERYIDELQAQTLLMLIRGGNLQVGGFLNRYLTMWGMARYGTEIWPAKGPKNVPDEDDPPSFFLGLTGIDEEFRNSHPTADLYEVRLKELSELAFADAMQHFRGEGRPFTNVYPVRYPGTLDESYENRVNLGLEKWDKARNAFLASERVRKYVASPDTKWDAAMTEGNGGVSLLASAFRQVTSSERKQDELARNLRNAFEKIDTLARSWRVDPDVNKDREKRLRLAGKVLDWLESGPALVNRRVRALEDTLCFRRGDVLPIADFADINPAQRDNPIPLERRVPDALRSFLREWATAWVPGRWQEYTVAHRDVGEWLADDTINALTRYLVDYFTAGDVFDRFCQRVLEVVTLRVHNLADRRVARRKYVQLMLNDYVMNPGDMSTVFESPSHDGSETRETQSREDSNGDSGGFPQETLMTAFVHRWTRRLPEVLAGGAGNEVNIPAGNDDLIEILDESETPAVAGERDN